MLQWSRNPEKSKHPESGCRGAEPAADEHRWVLTLDDSCAREPALAGAKAANLARALARGLPVLPGFVLSTAAPTIDLDAPHGRRLPRATETALRRPWETLSQDGTAPVVVRSSSTVEDAEHSSMAGQFISLLDVVGWEAFLDAVATVLASATGAGGDAPMAVLVQPLLRPAVGGVLFGLDPVSGDRRRLLVEAVSGGPDALVAGAVAGQRYALAPSGRLLDADTPRASRLLDARLRRRLTALAGDAASVFGGPQDVEWAVDNRGRAWLLQSRPVTAADTRHPTGPLLGPGPVAETFPEPLAPLEVDLWVEPLRAGLVEALRLGGASRRRLRRSPVVAIIGGRPAVDLELLGVVQAKRSLFRLLDPRPPARRLAAAWRVGRLRNALPLLIGDLNVRVDADLLAVPLLTELSDRELVGMLDRGRQALVATHGYEVLAGMLLTPTEGAPTGASLALAAVAAGRSAGWDDAEILARRPVTLLLVAPRVGASDQLGAVAGTRRPQLVGVGALEPREACRLRVRWLQALMGRAADELGRRMALDGRLADCALVRQLEVSELHSMLHGGRAPADLDHRARRRPGPPLPAEFRLADGQVVATQRLSATTARGAGGGRATGRVRHAGAGENPAPGDVLVVRTLDPGLAPLLPGLAGLVAETGAVLSHLAILARELGVPTVVGVRGAVDRFAPGSLLLVDGASGEVRTLPDPEPDR